jgi:sigma-B regulation protein RsbU (phosphoserine phosphatase)
VAIPSEIVRTLNNAMAEGNDTNMFVTVFVGVLDLTNGLLRYCNAGHEAPLLVGRDVGALSCDPNLPIGVLQGYEYTQQEVSIDSGTTIFLYTDGLNEAENYEHAQFGDLRIWNLAKLLLNEQRHQPKRMIDAMDNAVHTFVGDAEQSDDLTMLAIQYKK